MLDLSCFLVDEISLPKGVKFFTELVGKTLKIFLSTHLCFKWSFPFVHLLMGIASQKFTGGLSILFFSQTLNFLLYIGVSSVQSLSHVRLFATPWIHESQHTRLPCPSPTPRVHLNPCPLSRWCHPTISSSVVPFSSCPQSFPASGSFQMSQLFGQSIGASASVLLMMAD